MLCILHEPVPARTTLKLYDTYRKTFKPNMLHCQIKQKHSRCLGHHFIHASPQFCSKASAFLPNHGSMIGIENDVLQVRTVFGCTTCFCNDWHTAESDRVIEAKNVFDPLASLKLLHETSHLKQIITRFILRYYSTAGKINSLHFTLNCCQAGFCAKIDFFRAQKTGRHCYWCSTNRAEPFKGAWKYGKLMEKSHPALPSFLSKAIKKHRRGEAGGGWSNIRIKNE